MVTVFMSRCIFGSGHHINFYFAKQVQFKVSLMAALMDAGNATMRMRFMATKQ